jgi:hypothetical protein
MVDLGEAEIFKRKNAQALAGGLRRNFAIADCFHQLAQVVRIHLGDLCASHSATAAVMTRFSGTLCFWAMARQSSYSGA